MGFARWKKGGKSSGIIRWLSSENYEWELLSENYDWELSSENYDLVQGGPK